MPEVLGYSRRTGKNVSKMFMHNMMLSIIEDILKRLRLPEYRRYIEEDYLREAGKIWNSQLTILYSFLGRLFLADHKFSKARFWFKKLFRDGSGIQRLTAILSLSMSLLRLKSGIEIIHMITGRPTIGEFLFDKVAEERVLEVERLLKTIS
ncbi:MAG: hypothetical protein NC916_00275 [Candidatus Omnitrophica bacterium]|nr:hypothetical protein [Candidatus Omnitrophota bacterium]